MLGLLYKINGEELKSLFQERAKHHQDRAAFYQKRIAEAKLAHEKELKAAEERKSQMLADSSPVTTAFSNYSGTAYSNVNYAAQTIAQQQESFVMQLKDQHIENISSLEANFSSHKSHAKLFTFRASYVATLETY